MLVEAGSSGSAPRRVHILSRHLTPTGTAAVTDLRWCLNGPVPMISRFAAKFPALARALVSPVTAINRGPQNLHELIERNRTSCPPRVAVIGVGISGVQAMKACMAEGMDPVGFESDSDVGGFWRFKEEAEHPSVYRSTHIDSDRDLNSFGDFPWSADAPLLIHNTELTSYLRQNVAEFKLEERIKLNCTVTLVSPVNELGKFGGNKWKVKYLLRDPSIVAQTPHTELFDGVLICSGRHGGGGFMPSFKNQGNFKGKIIHSSQYKYPEKHGLVGKDVAVVGIGNSGADIVTEFGMLNGGGMRRGDGRIVNDARGQTYLVARSGSWVMRMPHMDIVMSMMAADRLMEGELNERKPWWEKSSMLEAVMAKSQAQLNRHGMKPTHRRLQQHPIISGFAGQVWLGDQLDKGWIQARRGIDVAKGFTEDGTGIWLNDKDGNPMDEPTKVDAVIFATGYRQQAGFVDPTVVDMRFEREGNDVPLYKGCLPISQYKGLGFVNFVQSLTFPCAEIQCRWLTRVFKGLIAVPSLEEQYKEMEETRNTLTAQFIDRQQLRVQNGIDARYYDDLADEIGCKPTFWRLLTQRPTAFWHALFAFGSMNQMPNRLVGPGRLEDAERWIEERYNTRFHGSYLDAGGKFDYNQQLGELKNGDGAGPLNRRKPPAQWVRETVKRWQDTLTQLQKEAQEQGVVVGPFDRTQQIREHLQQNLRYAKEDMEKRGIAHSLEVGAEVQDGYLNHAGQRHFAFGNRATSAGEGLLIGTDGRAPTAEVAGARL